jgi:DNA-binding response OmpR family regulator
MRILVVDDEEHLRRMMRLTLEAAGYEVAEATDGEEGLKLFDDGFQFDATLLDQRMPGIDGLETLRRMKRQRADSCIIMVTAYSTVDLAVDAMKLGAADFVRKPMTPETLRLAVAAALSKYDKPPTSARPSRPSTDSAVVEAPREGVVPPLEIWTTNGFFVRRAGEPTVRDDGTEHHFVVRRGSEREGAEVAVIVDPKAVAGIAKEARRSLSAAGAFWREQAERALVNQLWTEAALPDDGRLVITRVTGSMVDAAISWSKD